MNMRKLVLIVGLGCLLSSCYEFKSESLRHAHFFYHGTEYGCSGVRVETDIPEAKPQYSRMIISQIDYVRDLIIPKLLVHRDEIDVIANHGSTSPEDAKNLVAICYEQLEKNGNLNM